MKHLTNYLHFKPDVVRNKLNFGGFNAIGDKKMFIEIECFGKLRQVYFACS